MFETFVQVESFFEKRKLLGMKPGLDRINYLLKLMNNPQYKMQAIHVAGTNGKGSTVSFIKNALRKNGYKVGVFTSPSITGLTGHIFTSDTPISEEIFLDLFNEIYPAILQLDKENMSPTEFEIITALAILCFSKDTDIALMEAGMGGREDTTNCFEPILSIITNVARDHTRFLGETTAEIAYQKAGIIKQSTPVIIGDMDSEAVQMIEEEAQIKRAQILRLGEDFTYTVIKRDNDIQKISWKTGNSAMELMINMQGGHQMKNASIALMAVLKLMTKGFSIDLEKVRVAMKNTFAPGRFEIIRTEPLVVVDGAHNPAGIEVFMQTVEENYKDKKKHLIFAAFKDKELKTMLELLNGSFSSITLTSFDNPRAADAKELYNLFKYDSKLYFNDWKEAVDNTVQQTDDCYFITGSLNFIAEVRKYFLGEEEK
ncbi:bifunctional folylpolyglutamate synthase/dihydrofolate synthase [Virgibacillus ainsalahensis]